MKNNFNQLIDQENNLKNLEKKDKINQGSIEEIQSNLIQQDNIDIFAKMKANGFQEISDVIENIIYWIKQIESELQMLKTTLMIKLDEAVSLVRQWFEDLNNFKQKSNLSLNMQEIKKVEFAQLFLKKDAMDLIKQINSSYLQKIKRAKDFLKNEVEYNRIEKLLFEFCILESETQKKEQHKGQYKLINQIFQTEFCYSIAFNRQGTIMVSGSQDQIKIWRFQDGRNIECIQQIKGDSEIDYSTSLVFSQITNFFISGSYDSSIKYYYNQNDKWFKQAANIQHDGLVTCVILNNQEDQLISCSQDCFIFIWKINHTQKSIQFDYSLERHEKTILSLSINQSDTEFVSTGDDQKISIWKKDVNKKWTFNQLIDHSYCDVGCRISYITDTIIVWQQSKQPYIHFFEQQNEMYVQKHQLRFEQSESQIETYLFFFPTIYNKEKQVLIQKFNNKIYFIRFDDGTQQFKVDSNHIKCSSGVVFGNLTQDGKFLVIWDSWLTSYQIYELFYE